MNKITYFGLLGASTVLCLSLFQNCSKIATADLSSTAAGQKVSSTGTETTLPVTTATPTDTGGIVKNGTTEDSSAKSGTKKGKGKEKEDKDDVDAIAACLAGKAGHVGSIETVNGSSELSVDDEDRIENINGHMTIRPADGKARGTIGKIENINGHMVICNMDVDSIENVNGNVKLVNCSLKHGEDINGGVKIVVSEKD